MMKRARVSRFKRVPLVSHDQVDQVAHIFHIQDFTQFKFDPEGPFHLANQLDMRKESQFSISWAVISRVIVMSFSSRTFWNTDFNLPVISSFFIDVSPRKRRAIFQVFYFRTFAPLKATHFLGSCYVGFGPLC